MILLTKVVLKIKICGKRHTVFGADVIITAALRIARTVEVLRIATGAVCVCSESGAVSCAV